MSLKPVHEAEQINKIFNILSKRDHQSLKHNFDFFH